MEIADKGKQEMLKAKELASKGKQKVEDLSN